MASIADVYFTADLDDSRLQVDAKRAGDKAGTTMGKGITASIKKSWSGAELGKGLVQGLGLAGGLGAANLLATGLGKVTDFIGASIDASRDLNESMSKSKVIFGDSAGEIEAFGDTAAESMGISKQAAIEAAASFGNLFVGLDLGEKKAVEMSKGIVTLAGDLASFNNLDPGEVLNKLRSGLSGESEPLRSLGVFLTEAKVKAKAMQLGLGDAHGELTEGAKVLARYQLILDETGTAQGDFARTSDGLANSQRTAAAALIDAQAELGASFEPIALQVTKWQVDFLKGLGVAGDGLALFGDAFDNSLDAVTFWDTYTDAALSRVAGNTNDMAGKVADDLYDVRTSTEKTEQPFKDLATTVKEETGKVVVSFDDMVSALAGDVGRLIDEVRDPAIQAAELQTLKEEDAALQRIINSKESTDDEIRDARRRRLGITKQMEQTRLSLLESGNLTAKEADAWLTKLEKEYDKSTGSARADIGALIAKIKELRRITAKDINVVVKTYGLNVPGVPGRAHGGPVTAGQPYWVGELGPELVVPRADATVIPSAESMAMVAAPRSSGDTNITVALPTSARPDPFETARQLRRLADFGVLRPSDG